MRRHKKEAHEPPKNTPKPYSWECPICHEFFKSQSERDNHRIDIHGKYCYQRHSKNSSNDTSTWECKYCHAVLGSRRLLFAHYKTCNVKQSLPVNSLGRVINFDALQKSKETLKQRAALGLYKNRVVSSSTRAKLSDSRKQYLATHRVKYNWTGPLKQLSYAEQYFYDIVKTRCESIHWANNFRVSYYKLDFANLDSKVYFEVDGEQHYDEYGLYHDQRRTERLEQLGWKLVGRVRWKLFSKLSDSEKAGYVNTLLNSFMSLDYRTINSLSDALPVITSKRQLHREHQLSQAIIDGRVDDRGNIIGNALSIDEWTSRKDLILTCGVDISKFGWVEKVTKTTGLTKRKIENTIKRFPDVFEGKYFRRKWTPVEHKT